MAEYLIRLKPEPLPVVNAPAEFLVEGDLKRDYEDTKAILRVPWMGVVGMAFAAYRNFYRAFWPAFRETFAGGELAEICADLRRDAENAVLELNPAPVTPRLTALGYAPREIAQIREMIQIFSHGNAPYCLMATMGRLLLEGHELENHRVPKPFSGLQAPDIQVPFLLMEPHHADAPTRAVYDDIKARLGLPIVNTDYRALSRWPSYFALAWGDLRQQVPTRDYEDIVAGIHRRFVEAALPMQNPGGLTSEAMRAAAEKDGGVDTVLATVRLFQWLLPGLIANIAYFRAQFPAQ